MKLNLCNVIPAKGEVGNSSNMLLAHATECAYLRIRALQGEIQVVRQQIILDAGSSPA